MFRFEGKKNPERRFQAVENQLFRDEGKDLDLKVGVFQKKVLTYAVQLDEPFEVSTLEGLHTGKAGDWLAIGPAGEMYPIDQQVFADSYDEVSDGHAR